MVGALSLYPEPESWKQPGRMEEEPCSAQDLKVQQLMVQVPVQVEVEARVDAQTGVQRYAVLLVVVVLFVLKYICTCTHTGASADNKCSSYTICWE